MASWRFLLFSGFIFLDVFYNYWLLLFSLVCFSLKFGRQRENAFLLFLTHSIRFVFCVSRRKKTQQNPKTNDTRGFCHFVLRKKKKVGGFLIMALRRYVVEVAQMLHLFLCLPFAFSLLAAMDTLFVSSPPRLCPQHVLYRFWFQIPHMDSLFPLPNGSR